MAEKRPERSVARWDPFEEFDVFRGRGWPRLERLLRESEPVAPAIDIHENDQSFVVTAEIPGCDRDDVTVEAQDGVLTIRGEKRSEHEEKKDKARWIERRYGSFSRAFTLPANASIDKVSATFKDGVLRVEIPKAEESKPRVISIKS